METESGDVLWVRGNLGPAGSYENSALSGKTDPAFTLQKLQLEKQEATLQPKSSQMASHLQGTKPKQQPPSPHRNVCFFPLRRERSLLISLSFPLGRGCQGAQRHLRPSTTGCSPAL